MTGDSNEEKTVEANIALIGAGWWSQGWHLPALSNNPHANIIAIVDASEHPQSNLNPELESLASLGSKYGTQTFSSTTEMLNELGPQLDGVVIATSHATHYEVCKEIMNEVERRSSIGSSKSLHILMEKPMTTHSSHAIDLYNLRQQSPSSKKNQFWINHSANYRQQVLKAKSVIDSGILGKIYHINGSFASPLKWIFEDCALTGWNEPSEGMIGNGFAWGQSSHLFAYLYHLLPTVQPVDVFCSMTKSPKTGADIAHSATIRCLEAGSNDSENDSDYIVMNVTGTTLLPGNAHSDPPVPKLVQIDIFGSDASLHYGGNDRDSKSGCLELRHTDGRIEILDAEFEFENLDNEGLGPESLQKFVNLCCGSVNNSDNDCGANIMDGLRSIQTIDAMYRSNESCQLEPIIMP